jgi:hypothetical protein
VKGAVLGAVAMGWLASGGDLVYLRARLVAEGATG